MAVIDFADYFWGEKNDGFNVLYQNMKCGAGAAKELADLFREVAKVQEDTSKAHIKMVKQLSTSQSTGSFAPLLAVCKGKMEKLAAIHNVWMIKLNDLVKEVTKYSDDLQKTHKKVKEDESGTVEAVKAIQDTTAMLQKSKELYKQRILEVEKLKRDGAAQKDLEKAEAKFRKAQDDYKTLVDKYCLVRDNFEKKMTSASKHFQDVETAHLKQMREFVETYCQIVDNNNNQWERVQQEFQIQLSGLTAEQLLEQFALAKYTGMEKPGPIEFDEEKLSVASVTGPPSDISDKSGNSDKVSLGSSGRGELGAAAVSTSSTGIVRKESSGPSTSPLPTVPPSVSVAEVKSTETTTDSGVTINVPSSPCTPAKKSDHDPNLSTSTVASPVPSHCHTVSDHTPGTEESPSRSPYSGIAGLTGFLRRRQKKKKKDEDEDSQKGGASEGEDARRSQTPMAEVDKDGYTKQPSLVASDPWEDFNQPKTSFYSSSDDSDDDTKRKIKVEIKPVTNGGATISASVDELRTAIGGLELLPPTMSRHRPQSALNDRIRSGTQTMKKSRDTSGVDLDNSALRRSQSQSHVNKPSQDLLGLTLHPIEPIDEPETTTTSDQNNTLNDATSTTLDTSTLNNSANKEVRDIFGDMNGVQGQQPTLPAKQSSTSSITSTSQRPSSVQREKISNSLIALPRPPSRHGSAILASANSNRTRSTTSPVPSNFFSDKFSLSRSSDSPVNNKDPSPASGFHTSRGPSPLTLSKSDVIPLAIAFQEVCHACFRGADESQCQVRLIGDMMVSFPAGIVQILTNNPNSAALMFRIKNATVLETIVPNKHLISTVPTLSTNDTKVFEFDMTALKELLKKQADQNPNASYFNIDILKYQIKSTPGAGSCPLQMVAYWKCTDDHTDLRLDYKYNGHAMASANALLNVSIAVPIDGGVMNMQSKPNGTWISESNRALWKVPELSQDQDNGVGSLRGRFELSNGPGSQGTIAAQFNCEGTTLSGVEVELVGPGYRLSLVKKRFVSGKYVCDGDATPDNRFRYAAPL